MIYRELMLAYEHMFSANITPSEAFHFLSNITNGFYNGTLYNSFLESQRESLYNYTQLTPLLATCLTVNKSLIMYDNVLLHKVMTGEDFNINKVLLRAGIHDMMYDNGIIDPPAKDGWIIYMAMNDIYKNLSTDMIGCVLDNFTEVLMETCDIEIEHILEEYPIYPKNMFDNLNSKITTFFIHHPEVLCDRERTIDVLETHMQMLHIQEEHKQEFVEKIEYVILDALEYGIMCGVLRRADILIQNDFNDPYAVIDTSYIISTLFK